MSSTLFQMKFRIFLILLYYALTLPPVHGQADLANSLRKHVTILASDSLAGRGFGFPEKKLAIDYIDRQYRIAGFNRIDTDYIQDFIHIRRFSLFEGKNILGIIEGNDPILKKEYILLGAHYDHLGWKMIKGKKTFYNGADDNASGVASIIEIGKILMAKKEGLKRSIIIAAFDGEEAGLIGSDAFIESTLADSLNIKAMFSLDMVGMFSENEGVDLNGFKSLKNGEDYVREIAAREQIPVVHTADNIEPSTDTWPFGRKNIPSFYISTGLLSPYHKSLDDSHLLDYDGMGRIVKLISAIVSDMANLDTIEANSRFIKHAVSPSVLTGLTFGAGSSYHYYSGSPFNGKPVFAMETGITAQIKLSEHFLIQPTLAYEMTGSDTETGIIRTHSISPQLDLLISTPSMNQRKPVLFAIAGGYYRYNFAFSGKGVSSQTSEMYSPDDFGIKAGAGIGYMKYQVSFVGRFGLINASKESSGQEIFNREICMNFTYYF
jgi:aminopeptidase YwaD